MESGRRLDVENITLKIASGEIIIKDLSFSLSDQDCLAIVGPSGSGKTLLGLTLAGKKHFSGTINFSDSAKSNIVWIEQQHHFKNLSNTSNFYYQQRFNSGDAEDAHTVFDYLGANENATRVLEQMNIAYLSSKPLIQLSNGENKKTQLAAALLLDPTTLILDQPFTGLDVATRKYLHELLNKLASDGVLIVLITQPDELPTSVSKVLKLELGGKWNLLSRTDFESQFKSEVPVKNHLINFDLIQQLLGNSSVDDFYNAVLMKSVHVKYGDKTILDDIDWTVKAGERWMLSGHNGAGKSTLLSLINADNPQAYSNEIYLFDKRRGSGESIWDIKKKIGYLSPELHLFFDAGCSAFEAVASGLFDTIGLFRQLTDQQLELVQKWLGAFGMVADGRKLLSGLSFGKQRIILLIRALIKNPPLLILDEPCQGLDDQTEMEMIDLFDKVCRMNNRTMIYVTHYQDRVPACVNKIIKLENGRVGEIGSNVKPEQRNN